MFKLCTFNKWTLTDLSEVYWKTHLGFSYDRHMGFFRAYSAHRHYIILCVVSILFWTGSHLGFVWTVPLQSYILNKIRFESKHYILWLTHFDARITDVF